LKLILEVYETFTYPSGEGRAHRVARSCNMQAVSLLYLQTMYISRQNEILKLGSLALSSWNGKGGIVSCYSNILRN